MLVMVLPVALHAQTRAKNTSANTQAITQASPLNPDEAIIDILKDLRGNHLHEAELKVNELLAKFPNFQLGHLIRGDLLLMHVRPVINFGAAQNAAPDKLKDLREEAFVRIHAIQARPDPALVPRNVLRLRDDQKYLLIVDAKKSRLYHYENHAGQLKFIADYYVSQGKFGTNKFKQGDQKTPLGVYYITSRLPGFKLPDFYGPGALTLNYPNEWDRVNGRDGSGIWLHGVPSGNYSRPPLASDGCVVLSNVDFLKLSATIEIGKTPVIIEENVIFERRDKVLSEQLAMDKVLDDWRADVQSQNTDKILRHYSKTFKTLQGEGLNSWFFKQQALEKFAPVTVTLSDVTAFRYPGKEGLITFTFTQENTAGKNKASTRKRQYLTREADKWRIIYEAQI